MASPCAVCLCRGSATSQTRAMGSPQPKELLSPHISLHLQTQTALQAKVIMLLDLVFLITEFFMKKESKSVIKNYLGTQVNEM